MSSKECPGVFFITSYLLSYSGETSVSYGTRRFDNVFTKAGLMNVSFTLSFDAFNPQGLKDPRTICSVYWHSFLISSSSSSVFPFLGPFLFFDFSSSSSSSSSFCCFFVVLSHSCTLTVSTYFVVLLTLRSAERKVSDQMECYVHDMLFS